jgi:hypothetical protein
VAALCCVEEWLMGTPERTAVGAAALFFVASGAWALLAPSSFYEQVAQWPPYNQHFVHDLGVFQLGIGVSLIGAVTKLGAMRALLGGAATAAVVHVVTHVVDYDEGGRSSDPYVLGVVALAVVIGLVLEWRRT